MKNITLSHRSAIIAIRQFRINPENIEMLNLTKELMLSNKKYGDKRIEILVNSINLKHKNWRYKYHTTSVKLPKNSTFELDENISCISAEFLLIQMSNILPLEKLYLLGFEFCGTYGYEYSTSKYVNSILPLCTKSSIKAYFNKYKNLSPSFRGVKNMKKLLDVLEDNAASPMEARLYLKLCGDRKDGMYGCKNLKLNCPIEISEEAQQIAGQKTIVPDISNVEKKVAIEYNSKEFHENIDQGQKDQRRRDALVHDGWKVISFTPQQIYNEKTFHLLAIEILEALKQNSNFSIKDFERKRNQIFKLLN